MFIQLKDLRKVEITKDVCGHQGLSFIGEAYDNVLDKDIPIKMEVSNFCSCNAKIIKINKDITPKDSIRKFNKETVKLRMDFDLTLPKNETGYYTITELDKTEEQLLKTDSHVMEYIKTVLDLIKRNDIKEIKAKFGEVEFLINNVDTLETAYEQYVAKYLNVCKLKLNK